MESRLPKPRPTTTQDRTVVRPVLDEPLTDADRFLSPPKLPGEVGRLGPYRVLGVLGRGGMGAVYRAEDPRLKRQVAVKVLLPGLSGDPQAVARFRREAQAQAKVTHDNIIVIYGVEEANGVTYIAMPLLKGLTLSAALKTSPRPPLAELVRIVREIAEGLEAAHGAGLIHRDIKPGNIWLEEPKRRVKILDFGLARNAGGVDDLPAAGVAIEPPPVENDRTESLTRAGAVMGTPPYMSPEQARGEQLDRRSDIFSLGILLYQMATGRRPFNGANMFDILAAVAMQEPHRAGAVVPDLPPALDALIARMLAKDPARRPQSCAEVVDELEAIADGLIVRPVVVVPLSPVPGEPNPWEDLDSTHGETEMTAAELPQPEPAKPGPPLPKWLWPVVGGLGLVAVLALVAAAEPWKPKPPIEEAKTVTPVVAAPKKDAQRVAAEWILKQQGGLSKTYVYVQSPKTIQPRQVFEAADLPTEPFTITGVCLCHPNLADEPKIADVFSALGDIDRFIFSGPEWTDKRLAAVLGAMADKKFRSLEIKRCPEPLTNTAAAMGRLTVTSLEVTTSVPDAFPLLELGNIKGLHQVTIHSGVSNAGLDGVAQLGRWPAVFDFRNNPNISDVGLGRIVANPQRTDNKTTFFFDDKVTEAGANALADRFPETKVVWKSGPIGPRVSERRKAAAEKILARGGSIILNVAGALTLGKLNALETDSTIGYLTLANGSYEVHTGKMDTPFGDADLSILRDLNRQVDRLVLIDQSFTDKGYSELFGYPHLAGVRSVWIVNCDFGNDAIPAVARRQSLLWLDLTGTKVTDAGLRHLAGKLPVLNTLNLANTALTDVALDDLKSFQTLSSLDLKGTKMTADGIKTLRTALPHTRIRDTNGVTNEGAPRLTQKQAIKALFVRGVRVWNSESPISDQAKFGPNAVSLLFASEGHQTVEPPHSGWERKEPNGSVKKTFDGAELVSLFTDAKIADFRSLHFYNQNLTDDGFAGVLSLPAVRTLTVLTLADCAISDATAAAAAALPALEQLCLNGTKVTDAGVKRISELRPGLAALRLRDCVITDDAVTDLAKLKMLAVLDLKGTKVTEDGAKDLAAALPKCLIRCGDGKVLGPKK